MGDAPTQVSGTEADGFQCVQQSEHQVVAIPGPAVGEPLLGKLPDALVRVVLGGVGGKALEMEPFGAAAELPNKPASMGWGAVPKDDDVPAELLEQLPEEVARLELPDVLHVELEVEVEPLPLGRNRDARDRRDPVAPIEVMDRWSPANRRPGPDNSGCQLEARFIDKDEVGTQPLGVFFTLGHSRRTKRRISAWLRSRAFFCGFWWLHPKPCRSLPT